MIEQLSIVEIKLDTGEPLTRGNGIFFDGRNLGAEGRGIHTGTCCINPAGRAFTNVTIAHYYFFSGA
jgi:hypothetical protein